MSLIVSYSGLRGIVGESLTDEVAARFAVAFAELLQLRDARILVGRDTRASGVRLQQVVMQALAGAGTIYDLGIVATPTLQFNMQPFAADAAVCITASHNPSMWNGMKFFTGKRGTVLDGAEIKALYALYDKAQAVSAPVHAVDAHAIAVSQHVERVLAQVDAQRIRARRFNVALDSANGAGAEAAERLLRALGCGVRVVASARESEPVPEALGDLVAAMDGCDVGFAQDLDADRLALADETGRLPGEDATLVLAIDHLLQRQPGARVVTNSATTKALADVVAKYGSALHEVPVGEVNLSKALIAGGDFGGEGNGGVIYPPVSLGRDSLIGMALILEALAMRPERLSARLAALPHYHQRKFKRQRSDTSVLYDRVQAAFPEAQASRMDGLKLTFTDGAWLSVRPSNTEPIVRVMMESRSLESLDRMERIVTGIA